MDGQTPLVPVAILGRLVTVQLPADLAGRTHDIVVWRDNGTDLLPIGSWELELATPTSGLTTALQGQAGIISKGSQIRRLTTGGGRADFEVAGGRLSGGVGFTWYAQPDPDTGSRLSLDAFELTGRGVLFGDELKLRFGTLVQPAEAASVDGNARRAVSATLRDLSGRGEGRVFASQTSITTAPANITGLADPDDRVLGGVITFQPFDNSALTIGATGYAGRAPALPLNGTAGDVSAYGAMIKAPVGNLDVVARIDQTEFTEGSSTRRGQAHYASANLALPDSDGGFTRAASLAYEWIDVDFHAPLNPDLVVGQQGLSAGYSMFDQEWDISLAGSLALTNAGGPATEPVDRLIELSADISYTPDVFTGGFLRGSSFYLGASMLRQDRQSTPAGAGGPQDHTIWQLAAGVSRFQQSDSLSLLYTYDHIDIRSSGANDQKIHTLRGMASVATSRSTTVSGKATLRNTRTSGSDFWEAEGSAGLTYQLVPGRLDLAIEAGGAWYENPALEDYYFADQSLEWDLGRGLSLVASADYRKGQSSLRMLPGDGWILGIALRTEFAGASN